MEPSKQPPSPTVLYNNTLTPSTPSTKEDATPTTPDCDHHSEREPKREEREQDPPPSVEENNDDPHNLYDRYVYNQQEDFRQALVEIRQGEKRSCWLWFVFPTAPYFVDGKERGSSMNRHFALRSDDAVRAYLHLQTTSEGVNLRENYVVICKAVYQQIKAGNTLRYLFGSIDDVKVMSSLRLFRKIAKEMGDNEVYDVCKKILTLVKKEYPSKSSTDRKRSSPSSVQKTMTHFFQPASLS